MRYLAGIGMRMLANEYATLAQGQGRMILAGVTDLSAVGTGNAGPDLTAAIAGAPAGVPILLLDHQPRKPGKPMRVAHRWARLAECPISLPGPS